MRLLTTITTAALVMAATGCETAQEKEARGLVRTLGGDWVPKGTRFFGSGHPMEWPSGATPAFDPTVFNQAMAARQRAPSPVIVAPSSGITTATTIGPTTTVSTIGTPAPMPYPYYGY